MTTSENDPESKKRKALNEQERKALKRKRKELRAKRKRNKKVRKEIAMFEHLTDRARKIMQLANQEAQRFNHEYIGTEHLLLGLVREGSGVACNVIKNLGCELRKLRLETEKRMESGPEMITMGRLPQTPKTKLVLEKARDQQLSLGHNFLGSEHLLLGLLLVKEGVAGQVLTESGLTLVESRDEVLNLLGRGLEQDPEAQSERQAGHKTNLQKVDARPEYEGINAFDLKRQFQHLPRSVSLDEETLEEFWVTLNCRRGRHVFLIADSFDVDEFVDGVADRLANSIVPPPFERHGIGAIDQYALGKKLNLKLSSVASSGVSILAFERMTGAILADQTSSLDSTFLDELSHWSKRSGLCFLLNGNEQQWRAFVQQSHELSRCFRPIRIPHWSEAAVGEILKLEVSSLERHHLVKVSSEAIDEAERCVASWVSEKRAKHCSNHPEPIVSLLDQASSLAVLQATREGASKERSRAHETASGLRRLIESALAQRRFAEAKKIELAIDQIHADLLSEHPNCVFLVQPEHVRSCLKHP